MDEGVTSPAAQVARDQRNLKQRTKTTTQCTRAWVTNGGPPGLGLPVQLRVVVTQLTLGFHLPNQVLRRNPARWCMRGRGGKERKKEKQREGEKVAEVEETVFVRPY